MSERTWIRRIFHPTDFTKNSETAFIHALQLALHAESSLHILHVDPPKQERSWERFPKVRQTLARWGILPEGAFKSDLAALKLKIKKSIATGEDPRKAMLGYLSKKVPDLMVLCTQQREGLARFLKPSLAGTLARETKTLTLFLPGGVKGFVNRESGQVNLKRVLIPVDFTPPGELSIDMAIKFCDLLHCEAIEATLLHVEDQRGPLAVTHPDQSGWEWELIRGTGDPVEAIIYEAESRQVDLIVMGTAGRNGILDALRGSTTERVVQEAPCPVLSANHSG